MAKFLNALATIIIVYIVQCEPCKKISPCVCEFDEYNKIDLSKVIPVVPKPEEHFLDDVFNGTIYYFHGCTDGNFNVSAHQGVNDTRILKGSFIAQNVTNRTDVKVLGDIKQLRFNHIVDTTSAYELVFINDSTNSADVKVRLVCIDFEEPFVKVTKIKSTAIELLLGSSHACLLTTHPETSGGAVFLTIVGVCLIVYLTVGALYLYFMRGARGLELIPNIDFWRSLPGLVKDGILYLFSGCNPNTITTAETYDQI